MGKIAIAEGIYWVGAIDWNLRDFHGYTTRRGSTYNAYLILDEKVALIDTVKAPFAPEMLSRIAEIIDPARIDYVISNHVEMDHSGSLPHIMQAAPRAKLVTSEKHGETGLERTFHAPWPLLPVREGSQIELGKRRLTFIPVPMLHWPDSMVTYLEPDAILFSNDAFGQHLASTHRYDDEVGLELAMEETAMYYANILMPYPTQVAKGVEKVKALKPALIAPSHGIVWRTYKEQVMEALNRWSHSFTREKVLVIYDTMWGSTEKMARAIVVVIMWEGVEVKLHNLTISERSDIMNDALEARALVIGTPTIHNWLYPTVAGFLAYLRGLKPRGKLAAVFGSYGWGGGATRAAREELKQAGMEVMEKTLDVKFVPDDQDLERCIQFGQELAQRVKAYQPATAAGPA